MRWLAVFVVAAACGAKAPAGVGNVETSTRREASQWRELYANRPRIDLSWLMPDFHDELRWPLTGMNHPSLDPRFAVADQLAIGLTWQQLCARGVHKRVVPTQKELLSYLHAWCDVQTKDVDGALTRLTPLLGSTTLGLAQAVRQDIANILVDHGSADKAEHWLHKHAIKDAQVLDLLAAGYVEVGSMPDAFAINRRALDNDFRPTDDTTCRRLTRRIVIGLEIETLASIDSLKSLAMKSYQEAEPLCMRLLHKVQCWRDPSASCSFFFADENADTHAMLLYDSYYEWPAKKVGWFEWLVYVDKARLALPTPGAAELVLTALETSVAAHGDCANQAMGGQTLAFKARNVIDEIRKAPEGPQLEARLHELELGCPVLAK